MRKVEQVANIGHWEVNLITGKPTWSEQFFRILGLDPYTTTATVELGISTVHPEDREKATAVYQRAIETNESYKIEKRIIRPSGEIRHILSEGLVEQNKEGKAIRLFGIFRDITADKNNEDALFKSAHEIENILNTAQDLIVIFDLKGKVQKISQSSQKILGHDSKEMIEKSLFDFICPQDLDETENSRTR